MVVYTTTDKVANLLQIETFTTTTTTPTIAQIETIIDRMEDKIDEYTFHSWRTTTITDEYLSPNSPYTYGSGIALNLKHRKIQSLIKLEIWDGSNWADWVATKTEGRNKDYWVDYTNGIVFIFNNSLFSDKPGKVTYTYGESSVSGVVEDICTKMTAIDVLNMYDKLLNFVDDGSTNRPSHEKRIEVWQANIDEGLSNLKEFSEFK